MFRKIVFLILALVFSVSGMVNAKETGHSSERLKTSLPRLQMPFIENKGQVHEDVAYYARTFGGTVFVAKDGKIVYSLPEGERSIEHLEENKNSEKKADREPQKVAALYETLVGGSMKAVKAEAPSETKVNYFIGDDPSKWKSGLSTYELVSLGEVYEGIETKLKAYGNNVEKLFYVKPGANPADIKIKLEGAKGIRVNREGELEVKTGLGTVKFTKPVAYQEIEGRKVEVEVSYVIARDEVPKQSHKRFGIVSTISKEEIATPLSVACNDSMTYAFKLGEYDRTKTLIIDPLLASTFLGGNRGDWSYALAIDSSGNVYVAGITDSGNFPAGGYDTSYGGNNDAFVSKLDSNLTTLLASTFLGGVGHDWANALAIDGSGNVYVAGETRSSDFPTTEEAYDRIITSSYNPDAFVSKLNSDLTILLASTFLGGDAHDRVNAIALDIAGNVYVTGNTGWPANMVPFPTTPGAYDRHHNDSGGSGGGDPFVSKLNSDLTALLASTFLGGDGYDEAFAITLDSAGNVFVAGDTYASNYPTTEGAYDRTFNGGWGGNDVFVSKLNSDLTALLASTFLGGIHYDAAYTIALDSAGNVYVAGKTKSFDFPTTDGAYDTTFNDISGGNDAFISKLNSDLTNLLASTYLGGGGDDGAKAIVLDSSGNVFMTGWADSSDFPTTQGAYDTSHNGRSDVFISKLNPDLTGLLASTFLGGSWWDYGYSIALDGSGNVFVTGRTGSQGDFPTTPGAYDTDTTNDGYPDAFVSKLDSNLSGYTLTVNKSGTGNGTVTSSPAGINCGTDCTETYSSDTTVTLTAMPATGSSFAGWGGDCSGTALTVQVSMEGARTCTATFNLSLPIVDFDGDGKTDIAVYRTNTGAWYIIPSSNPVTPYGLGWGGDPTDKPAPGDYDGDGKTDIAIYRTGIGAWYVIPSSNPSAPYGFGWGGDPTDKPAPGDYDGDGKTDIAVYRTNAGAWYVYPSGGGSPYGFGWGGDSTDKPAPGDYDGDGKTDIAVYRGGTGAWYVYPSGGGSPYGFGWGGDSTDKPVPGDYDEDGKTDIAVYRVNSGAWYIKPSSGGSPYGVGWGGHSTDKPTPGDYDGDGKTDIAVYRNGTGAWYIYPSGGGSPYGVGWGGDPSDIPVTTNLVSIE